jgi:prepilin signal peptidase PulO-like enzyme (type II secretory pathway)
MLWLLYTGVFVLGLIVGSFINCVVYRLHTKKSFVRGRSFCPHCKKQILWYDNIPVLSYLLLKAKCRFCKKSISIYYPIVELTTAILFLIVFIATPVSLTNLAVFLILLLRNWAFTFILIVIFLYDLKFYLILDKITLPAILIALLINLALFLTKHDVEYSLLNILGNYLLAALVCGGFFMIQFIISKGKWIGGGDIRLGFLMGLMLGWPNILIALAIAYMLGSLVGILLILLGKKTIKSQIALGTFLSLGTFIALIWGKQLIDWYLGITF